MAWLVRRIRLRSKKRSLLGGREDMLFFDGFYKVAELKGVSEYEIQASSRCGGLGEEVRWNFLCVGDEGRGGGEWREGRWSQARIKPCSNFCVGP
ncbi:hypothetical protein YC2023_112145 [Brassica napus]